MTDLHDVEMYDMDGEDLILGGSSRAALPATTGLARPEERATDMVTCRESNQFDTVLMQGMIEQTLSYCKHLPSTGRRWHWASVRSRSGVVAPA